MPGAESREQRSKRADLAVLVPSNPNTPNENLSAETPELKLGLSPAKTQRPQRNRIDLRTRRPFVFAQSLP